jgi:transposase
MQFYALDQLLDPEHKARLVWAFVESVDLEVFYKDFRVSSTQAGRTAIAPEILLALWLYATIDSVGSAREIARLTEEHIAYRWICGGVSVNYHTLSDFRSRNGDALDKLLVDSVAALVDQGLIPLETIAQDGMRVRASAGKSSFRRKPSLQQLQEQAQEHLENLQQERSSHGTPRSRSAKQRATEDYKKRIDEAIRQHEALRQQREKREKGLGEETRVSTTDPDARNMKMANGGFSPAYNVQYASDSKTRMVISVSVTNDGTDGNQMEPMHRRVHANYRKVPKTILVDSAYATRDGVTAVERSGTEVVSTIPKARVIQNNGGDPHQKRRGDTPEFTRFRERMAQAEYQQKYKERPSIAEFTNMNARNHGLQQFLVRGLSKVRAVAVLHALATNLTRMISMQWVKA